MNIDPARLVALKRKRLELQRQRQHMLTSIAAEGRQLDDGETRAFELATRALGAVDGQAALAAEGLTYRGGPTPDDLDREIYRGGPTPDDLDREIAGLGELIERGEDAIERSGRDLPGAQAVRQAQAAKFPGGGGSPSGGGGDWAARAATAVLKFSGAQARALVSGSVEVPGLVAADVQVNPHPERLLDLLIDRVDCSNWETNEFTYLRQTVRTNNAAPVADSALKPTSVFTVADVNDRFRVIAHLTEAVPQRYLEDHESLRRWLGFELQQGVLDALEDEIVTGPGTGEHFRGITATSGVTAVAFATDVVTTLRKARTAMQALGEKPTAWVLNPADAEAVDLTREGESGAYLTDGYEVGNGRSGNIFGGGLTRVVSTSVPAGTALLADWNQVKLYVRQECKLAIDTSGDHFTHNTVIARGEGRYGLAVLRPQAFAVVDLTA